MSILWPVLRTPKSKACDKWRSSVHCAVHLFSQFSWSEFKQKKNTQVRPIEEPEDDEESRDREVAVPPRRFPAMKMVYGPPPTRKTTEERAFVKEAPIKCFCFSCVKKWGRIQKLSISVVVNSWCSVCRFDLLLYLLYLHFNSSKNFLQLWIPYPDCRTFSTFSMTCWIKFCWFDKL